MLDPYMLLISMAVFLCAALSLFVVGSLVWKGSAFVVKVADRTTLWQAGLAVAAVMVVAGIAFAVMRAR